MPNTTPVVQVGTTAQRAASAKILGLGDYFIDTDTGRLGLGDGVTAANLLPHVKGTRYDGGEAFMAKCDQAYGTAVLFIAGDSTSATATRWGRRIATRLAAQYPAAGVSVWDLWDDTAQAYPSGTNPLVVQAGTSSAGVTFDDTFTRTAADLKGTTPDIGSAWGGPSGAAGDWSINGTKAVATSDASRANITGDGVSSGDCTLDQLGVTLATTGSASSKQWTIMIKTLDATTYIQGRITVSTSGVVTTNIYKFISGVATSIASGSAPIANNTASVTFDQSLTINGTTVTYVVNGVTITGTLTSGEQAMYAPATGFSMGSFAAFSGATIDRVRLTINNAAPVHQIRIYNGSYTGSILSYQQARLATMCPVTPDLVVINSGHNYGTYTPAQYLAAVDQFINATLALWPTTGWAVKSQNPEKAPSTGIVTHQLRNLALSSYVRQKGGDYIGNVEAYRALGDQGASLVRSVDGIHPTDSTDTADASSGVAATNGAQLDERVVLAWLNSKSKRSTPLT